MSSLFLRYNFEIRLFYRAVERIPHTARKYRTSTAAKPIAGSDEETEVPAKVSKIDYKVDKKPTPKNFSEKESENQVGSSKSSFRLFKELPDCESIKAPENVAQISEEVFDENSFANLTPPLHEYLVKNLKDEGKTKLTKVQKESLPHALMGKDLKVKAQTGSGKTLVYWLFKMKIF